jgi:acyl-coenzyme A synthetase/AMP-(fatty) acid ligase
MEYTNTLRFQAEDRMALLSPCTFSLSVGFIYGALLNGGCLYPLDVKGDGLAGLAKWFAEERVTVYNSVPALFRDFVHTLTPEETLPKLRLIHLGGEPVSAMDVELYKKHFSASCVLVHHWGSNETGTVAQSIIGKTTAIHGNTAPASRPGEGRDILVLDEDGNPLGFNHVGEIAVKSRHLAVGYWRKPELTKAAFLRDPAGGDERIFRTGDLGLLRPDGFLEHHGRKDFQIKVRGQRVEIAEIDIALSKHESIKEAVTIAREDTPGDKRLVAYVVPNQRPASTSKDLRMFLQERLPDYMVPSVFVFVEAMPLTPSGKLDRRALPIPCQVRDNDTAGCVMPSDTVEHQLVEIWQKLLNVQPVGINDNFFDIGGHSLLLLKLHGELQATFKVDIPMVELFVYPTIHTQALYLRQMMERRPIEESGGLVERQRSALERQRGLQAIASAARRGTAD